MPSAEPLPSNSNVQGKRTNTCAFCGRDCTYNAFMQDCCNACGNDMVKEPSIAIKLAAMNIKKVESLEQELKSGQGQTKEGSSTGS